MQTLTVPLYAQRTIPLAIRRMVIERDGLHCRRCARRVVRRGARAPYEPDTLHLDHVKPWSEGGEHAVDNLIVCCADCNLRRPRPVAVVRQGSIRVEERDGGYFWPQGYSPPSITTECDDRMQTIPWMAEALDVSPAEVLRLVATGSLSASATGAIHIEVPDWLIGARVSRPAKPVSNKVPTLSPTRSQLAARQQEREDYWRSIIQARRDRQRTKKRGPS